jgi:Na+/glutamate symporter
MVNFWDFSIWGTLLLFAVLFGSLLAGNVLKKGIPFLRSSLIPTSVLGGAIILIVEAIFKAIAGYSFFEARFLAKTPPPAWRSLPTTPWRWALSPLR